LSFARPCPNISPFSTRSPEPTIFCQRHITALKSNRSSFPDTTSPPPSNYAALLLTPRVARLPNPRSQAKLPEPHERESRREGGAMILRTPQQRKRRADADPDAVAQLFGVESMGGFAGRSPVSDRRMMLYDRPNAIVPSGAPGEPFDDMVCTYHCRQMVRSLPP
jgi:hypothetical protein